MLKNHLDGVRDLFFCANDPILTTVSEDSTIKIWDTRSFESEKDLEPFYTLRDSGSEIFAVTGN